MVFGHILRGLRIAGVVGRFEADGDPGPYVGECLSACVYALMGAVRRVAPPGSEVGLHRMSIVESEGGGLFGSHVKRSFADPPMVAVLGRYARRMGVNPALVQDGRIAASRHGPRSHARGNAALVIGDKSILTASATHDLAMGASLVSRRQGLRPHRSLTWKRAWLIRSRSRGGVAQLVRAPACHAGGRGFKSRLSRQLTGFLSIA